ncbi:LysR family transcriptional regulator [Paracoccus seriniphilus]|uniref:LysR family transcriptional regulator n=1 Tax=Paracoccus seriniphilus TaxID=184748 RepID=UPI0035670934
MRPRQLIQFLAVCRLGSMSAAAKELGIAQPALSKQISQLEHELQAKLFERHSRGVAPTKAGEKLREEAADLIRRLDSIKHAIHDADNEVAGSVTLAVITSLAAALAVELYPRVERRHPMLSLHIVDRTSDGARDALLRHEVDLAIIPNVATDLPKAASIPLFEESFQFISRASSFARPRSLTLAEAAAQPLVLPFHSHDLRRRIEETARATGVTLNVKYETSSINVIGRLVEEGLACSIVPTTFWLDKIGAGLIAAQQLTSPGISRVHSLCWMADTAISPAVSTMRELIRSEVAAMLAVGKLSGAPSFQ